MSVIGASERHTTLALTLKTDTLRRMGRYRKILVAVDGSESSKNAFRQACRIARDDKSWITVITAIPFYQDQFEVLSTREKVGLALREEGDRILSDIKRLADEEDAFIKLRLEEGSAFDTIIDVSEEGSFDLIVMGRRGKSRLEKALVGSVAARVIGHSRMDVLVVPMNASIGWKNIIVPTDGSRYSKTAAEKAIDLAKSYEGKLKIVSVVDVTEEFQSEAPAAVEKLVRKAKEFADDIKKNAETQGIIAEAYVKEGETFKMITDIAGETDANLIIMGSHGSTGLRRLLMGSVTEKVIGYSPCPVLVVKN